MNLTVITLFFYYFYQDYVVLSSSLSISFQTLLLEFPVLLLFMKRFGTELSLQFLFLIPFPPVLECFYRFFFVKRQHVCECFLQCFIFIYIINSKGMESNKADVRVVLVRQNAL